MPRAGEVRSRGPEHHEATLHPAASRGLLIVGSPAAAADGGALYDKHCGSCHGPAGKNGKDVAVAGRPQDVVSANIKDHPLSMDSFKLSSKQVKAIAQYVAGLKP